MVFGAKTQRVTAFGCDFKWSMQHLISTYREEDVEHEATTNIYYTETDKSLMWDRWQKGTCSLETRLVWLALRVPVISL
jgi:hypothetical protein